MQKYTFGGVAIFVLVLAVTFCQWGGNAAAQSPTVTPYPGPAATATAAVQRMTQAQQQQAQGAAMKAQADAQRARAAQLETAGNDAINSGIASYAAAASDAERASAALQAQQVGIASELLARSQSNIATGKAQLAMAQSAISELSGMVDTQASTIISLTTRLQQAETNVTTLRNAYTATVAQQDAVQKQSLAGNAITLLAFVAALFVLIAWAAQAMRNRRDDPPASAAPAPPLEGEYTVSAEDEQL